MTANDNQPYPYRNEQQRIAELEAFAERLVKSEQKYRMIVEHADEAIIMTIAGWRRLIMLHASIRKPFDMGTLLMQK